MSSAEFGYNYTVWVWITTGPAIAVLLTSFGLRIRTTKWLCAGDVLLCLAGIVLLVLSALWQSGVASPTLPSWWNPEGEAEDGGESLAHAQMVDAAFSWSCLISIWLVKLAVLSSVWQYNNNKGWLKWYWRVVLCFSIAALVSVLGTTRYVCAYAVLGGTWQDCHEAGAAFTNDQVLVFDCVVDTVNSLLVLVFPIRLALKRQGSALMRAGLIAVTAVLQACATVASFTRLLEPTWPPPFFLLLLISLAVYVIQGAFVTSSLFAPYPSPQDSQQPPGYTMVTREAETAGSGHDHSASLSEAPLVPNMSSTGARTTAPSFPAKQVLTVDAIICSHDSKEAADPSSPGPSGRRPNSTGPSILHDETATSTTVTAVLDGSPNRSRGLTMESTLAPTISDAGDVLPLQGIRRADTPTRGVEEEKILIVARDASETESRSSEEEAAGSRIMWQDRANARPTPEPRIGMALRSWQDGRTTTRIWDEYRRGTTKAALFPV